MKKLLGLGCVLAASALSVSAQLAAVGDHGLKASVSPSGSWSVYVPAMNWSFAGTTGVPVHSLRNSQGADAVGDFSEILFNYSAEGAARSASIRVYAARPVVQFQVSCDSACNNTAPFPVISSYPSLLHLSYNNEFAEPDFVNLAPDSPWIFFDSSSNAFVLSPGSDFMTSSLSRNSSETISSGISSQISKLPAGLTHRTLLTVGAGINSTIETWGDSLTALTGKQRPTNDADAMLKSISYWTDNGATYYYNPGDTSYMDTLLAMKDEFAGKGIHLGSLQLDSWWYPKGPDNNWSSHSGIWTYAASPALFPPGLPAFQSALGSPLVTHARWIDANSPYRSQYTISANAATDPAYWEDIANYLQSAGVTSYEQDWLSDAAHTEFNLTDPNAFLGNMAASMARRGMTIQYCMALPKHFLQSANYSNVTSIRTSQDRFGAGRFTNFFYSSRFARAVGAWPFSDVLMSKETRNLIAATLSAGPLGIGDPAGEIAAGNLLKAVRPDGVIVKPDISAVPLDSVYVNDALKADSPMIAAASTDYGRDMRAHYLVAYSRGSNTTWTVRPSDFGVAGAAYLYNLLTGDGRLIDENSAFTASLTAAAEFHVLVPVGSSGIAFLGDKGHYVTLGHKRITTLTDNGKVDASVAFADGELSRVLFGYSPGPVSVISIKGTHSGLDWDPTTQIFTVRVRPSTARVAEVRIVQKALATACDARCGLDAPARALAR